MTAPGHLPVKLFGLKETAGQSLDKLEELCLWANSGGSLPEKAEEVLVNREVKHT